MKKLGETIEAHRLLGRIIPSSIFIYKDRGQYQGVQRSDVTAMQELGISLVDDSTLTRCAISLHRNHAGLYQLVIIEGERGRDAAIASRSLFILATRISDGMEIIHNNTAKAAYEVLRTELNEILYRAKRAGVRVVVPGADEPAKLVDAAA